MQNELPSLQSRLIAALDNNDERESELLLKAHPELVKTPFDSQYDQTSVLHYAINGEHFDIVRQSIRSGADVPPFSAE